MLRLAKWCYDLGIRHERIRIASHLQMQVQSQAIIHSTSLDVMRETDAKDRKKKLEFQAAVAAEVEQIVQGIMAPRSDWVELPSFLFPDDEHKGKIK